MSDRRLIALRYPNQRLAARLIELWDEGFAVLPLSPGASDSEVGAMLAELKPDAIEDESGLTRLAGGLPVDGEVALVVATSGSSGRPKGVELTSSALDWSARACVAQLGVGGEERWLSVLPISHIAGLGILVRSRLSGNMPVIHDRFDPQAIAGEQEATLISLVPTTLLGLLDAGVDLARYSVVLVGGSRLSDALAGRAEAAGIRVVQTYGLTETCGGCNFDGVPLKGAEFRVEDERILIRGPMLMRGYRLRPELTAEALDQHGWLNTADRGRIGQNGALEVLGRLDEMILTGGENVSSEEVETHLLAHPGVADVAVAGVADYRWGHAVAALVVPRDQAAPTLRELKAFLVGRLAGYKAPKRILIVSEIPRTASGKIRRQAVKDLLEASE